MTHEEIGTLARNLAPVVRAFVAEAMAAQTATLQQTATRVAALEASAQVLADLPLVRDRISRLEASAATAADDRQVLGQVRERIAAVEATSLQGPPGPPGPPGVGLDDYQADFDGERTLTLTLKSAAGAKTIPMVFPVPLYVGIFRPGTNYRAGDMVTWEGSSWLCREPTSATPGEGATPWRLVVKRGRDGKDAGR